VSVLLVVLVRRFKHTWLLAVPLLATASGKSRCRWHCQCKWQARHGTRTARLGPVPVAAAGRRLRLETTREHYEFEKVQGY